MKAASAGMRDISSELGGKNAAIVFADCDLDKAVAGTVRSSFTNCGQICLCTERVYVERPIFDSFVDGLKAATERLKLSHPELPDGDIGPLISKGHRDKVLSYYEMAKAEGARILVGGVPTWVRNSLTGHGLSRPFGPDCRKQAAWSAKRFLDRVATYGLLTLRKRQYGLPTTALTAWRR